MICSCVSLRLIEVGAAEGESGFPYHEITGHSALCDSPEKNGLEGFQGEASHARCCILSKDGKEGFLFSSPSLSMQ